MNMTQLKFISAVTVLVAGIVIVTVALIAMCNDVTCFIDTGTVNTVIGAP